jgi:hypothetical protein
LCLLLSISLNSKSMLFLKVPKIIGFHIYFIWEYCDINPNLYDVISSLLIPFHVKYKNVCINTKIGPCHTFEIPKK